MNWKVICIIGGMAIIAGVVIYLPFFFWFRWRGSKPTPGAGLAWRVTRVGLCFYGAMTVVLFWGLVVGQFSPQSWFGSQLQTLFGTIGYLTVFSVVASVIERTLVSQGFVFSYRLSPSPGLPRSDTWVPSGSAGGASKGVARIRIISVPPGEAPVEVREAWVGLTLPVAVPGQHAPQKFTVVGVRSDPYSLWSRLTAVFRTSAQGTEIWEGYPVEIMPAIWLLEQNGRMDAAMWWCKQTPHLLRTGQVVIFPTLCCELIEGAE